MTDPGQTLRASSSAQRVRDEFELLLAQRHQIDILQISLLNYIIRWIEDDEDSSICSGGTQCSRLLLAFLLTRAGEPGGGGSTTI